MKDQVTFGLQVLRRLVLATAGSLLAAGCGGSTPEKGDSNPELQCDTAWFGELPAQSASLIIRACLKDDVCTHDMVLPLEDDWSRPGCVDDNVCERHVADDSGALQADVYSGVSMGVSDPVVALAVRLHYDPELAATFAPGDRPTLTIQAKDGSMMVDSAAVDDYQTVAVPPEDPVAMCRNAYLNLDGSSQPDPPW